MLNFLVCWYSILGGGKGGGNVSILIYVKIVDNMINSVNRIHYNVESFVCGFRGQ